MKINGELGKVLSTSPEHKQWNCGMGIFKPGVVYWEENPEGRVIIDGKRCKIIKKSDAMVNLYKVTKYNTLRFLFENSDYDPVADNIGTGGTWEKKTEFSFTGNIWDWTSDNNSWSKSFQQAIISANPTHVIAGNFSGTSLERIFQASGGIKTFVCNIVNGTAIDFTRAFDGCDKLEKVIITGSLSNRSSSLWYAFANCYKLTAFDISDISNGVSIWNHTFTGCRGLSTIPELNLYSGITDVRGMCENMYNVAGGALDLYNELNQISGLTQYANCFTNCGRDTVTGAAELAQIPTAWGGTAE